MEAFLTVFGLILFVAFMVESLVEYLLGTAFDKLPKLAPFKWALMYAGAAAGIGAALFYRFDLVYLIARLSGDEGAVAPGLFGMVLTGLAIGRGAGFLNDLLSKLPGKPPVA